MALSSCKTTVLYRFDKKSGEYHRGLDFHTGAGSVTSLRWLPDKYSKDLIYSTATGNIGIVKLSHKSTGVIRSAQKSEYLAMDVNKDGGLLAVADKTGQVVSN